MPKKNKSKKTKGSTYIGKRQNRRYKDMLDEAGNVGPKKRKRKGGDRGGGPENMPNMADNRKKKVIKGVTYE